jgi:sugar lactone lactonase YvrE
MNLRLRLPMKSLTSGLFIISSCYCLQNSLSLSFAEEATPSILDQEFGVKKVAADCEFTEGPVAAADGTLYFSDGESDRIMRLNVDGSLVEHRKPAGRPNGMILDREGRLIVCQSAGNGGKQRVVRIENDGTETVLADKFDGHPFVGPNDLCQDLKGRVYFTDPIYEKKPDTPQPTSGVYRIDAPGKVVRIIENLQRPNGILLSPDELFLYVSDRGTQQLHRYNLHEHGTVSDDKVVYDFAPGRGIDGMTIDSQGRIFGAAGEKEKTGLYVVDTKSGKLLHFEPMPEFSTNVTFGGQDHRDLYLTASTSVYKMRTREPGVRFPVEQPLITTDSTGPKFTAQTIDDNVEIGYGVAIGDVDGDGKPDILLADKKQFVWYQNPTWKKHLLAENLTLQDNVCIAARDINGDGKVEIAVGAEWNPGDTSNSGAVFYLLPPEDRTQPWTPIKLHHEPVVHRMRWVKTATDKFALVVAPLHGRGNRNGEGDGVRLLAYHMLEDPRGEWRLQKLDDSMHVTHNFDVVQWDQRTDAEEILLIGREGAKLISFDGDNVKSEFLAGPQVRVEGGGEIRTNRLSYPNGNTIATIEPFHGSHLVAYTVADNEGQAGRPDKVATRIVLDDQLNQGHALLVVDVLGAGWPQIIAGWREPNRAGQVGLKIHWQANDARTVWRSAWIDENGIAAEDIQAADLNGDGRNDLVASGRATKNLKIYWNAKEIPPE